MPADKFSFNGVSKYFGNLEISPQERVGMDYAGVVGGGVVRISIDEPAKDGYVEVVPMIPLRSEALSSEEADKYFGDYMFSEGEVATIKLANQIDCRYPRKVSIGAEDAVSVEVDRGILQILGVQVGMEVEEVGDVDADQLALARLLTTADWRFRASQG